MNIKKVSTKGSPNKKGNYSYQTPDMREANDSLFPKIQPTIDLLLSEAIKGNKFIKRKACHPNRGGALNYYLENLLQQSINPIQPQIQAS